MMLELGSKMSFIVLAVECGNRLRFIGPPAVRPACVSESKSSNAAEEVEIVMMIHNDKGRDIGRRVCESARKNNFPTVSLQRVSKEKVNSLDHKCDPFISLALNLILGHWLRAEHLATEPARRSWQEMKRAAETYAMRRAEMRFHEAVLVCSMLDQPRQAILDDPRLFPPKRNWRRCAKGEWDSVCQTAHLLDTEIEFLYQYSSPRSLQDFLPQSLGARGPVKLWLFSNLDCCDTCTIALLHPLLSNSFAAEVQVLAASCFQYTKKDRGSLWNLTERPEGMSFRELASR
jgi:hypothetical protein